MLASTLCLHLEFTACRTILVLGIFGRYSISQKKYFEILVLCFMVDFHQNVIIMYMYMNYLHLPKFPMPKLLYIYGIHVLIWDYVSVGNKNQTIKKKMHWEILGTAHVICDRDLLSIHVYCTQFDNCLSTLVEVYLPGLEIIKWLLHETLIPRQCGEYSVRNMDHRTGKVSKW